MRFSEEQIERRSGVWEALSELFLDTELDESDFRFIARRLVDSGFTDDELADILWMEVYPVCVGNLRCVAGEWAGFSKGWLQGRILATPRRWWRRYGWFQPNWSVVQEEWEKVMRFVRESRAGQVPG